MRKLLFILFVGIWSQGLTQSVGINTDGSSPHPSSILHLKDSAKGFLAPRLTTIQRLGINSPAEGLLVYDINTKAFWYYTDGTWEALLNDEYLQDLYHIGDTLRLTLSDSYVTRNSISYWTKSGQDISRSMGNVGIGTSSPLSQLHIDETFQVSGIYGSGDSLLSPGNVPRMFFYPRKGAFRAGGVFGDEWDEPNIGAYSTALGFSSSATGDFGVSLGYYNEADGDYSTAIGRTSHAEANYGVAIGHSAWSYSPYETALGSWNTSYTPNSSIVWNENDRLLVVGNGTTFSDRSDALTILKNGNIGIGTSEPTAHVQISGSNFTDALLWDDGKTALAHGSDLMRTERQWFNLLIDVDNSQNNAHFAIYNDSTNSDGEAVVNFHLDGGDSWINSGNVGIGTTSPTTLLQVAGDAKIDGSTFNVDAVNNKVGIGTASPTVRLDVEGSVKVDGTTFNVDAVNNKVGIGTTTPTVRLDVEGSVKVDGSTFNVDAVNNKVGIGTTTPTVRLDVVGSVKVDGSTFNVDHSSNNVGIGTAFPSADLEIFGNDGEDAIMLNGGSHVIRHGNDFLATTYNNMRILLDSDDNQEFGGGFEIYNNLNTSNGFPQHRFAADSTVKSFIYGLGSPGKLGINTANPQVALHVEGHVRIESMWGWFGFESWPKLELWSSSGGLIGEWASMSGAYSALSDMRLKRNISDLSDALDMVNTLQPKTYQFKAEETDATYSIGFLAQEVKEVLPGAVSYNKKEDRYTMDYSAFGVLAIQAIKEQQTQIEQLTALTEALLNRVESLEKEVSGVAENE